MKTFKNLWTFITSTESLIASFYLARRRKALSSPVLKFQLELEKNVFEIQEKLLLKTWKPGPLYSFKIYEPKERMIHAPTFRDRVVHHSLMMHINPLFERRFIYDSYACRVNKGTHAASKRVSDMIRSMPENGPIYFLKADISKYFPSINHNILFDRIKHTIADKDVLWLIELLIFENGFNEIGIPIGSLPSQIFANVYLDKFDHYIKDTLGIKRYVRYMDDFIIIDNNKKYLNELKGNISDWLGENLKLKLNVKTKVSPISQGIDFAGYRHWTTHIKPRKRNVQRAKRKFKVVSKKFFHNKIGIEKIIPIVASFLGYMKHCNGIMSTRNTLKFLNFRRKEYELFIPQYLQTG